MDYFMEGKACDGKDYNFQAGNEVCGVDGDRKLES